MARKNVFEGEKMERRGGIQDEVSKYSFPESGGGQLGRVGILKRDSCYERGGRKKTV